ncbi:MAG: DUF445 domain-containing protein [Deltaproteobacteria bacterium]|nr:MAG: DUF445 domain-containing protein [Deltaproteobacteria bacterium]
MQAPRPVLSTPRRNHVGSISLAVAVVGAAGCRIAILLGAPQPWWLELAAAGFEAAVVGGLADWFAVTALFRHPLGIPIPHTAIIPARRQKIVEGIVSMIEDEWLSPDVIGARLQRIAPSRLIVEWLRDPGHVQRVGQPVRDLLRAVAGILTEDEVAEFVDRTIQQQLRELPIDPAAGRWLVRAVESDSAGAAFRTLALSLANLTERPRTSAQLQWWLERTARTLRAEGKRLVPLFLRRKIVQRKIIEATCDYAAAELRNAADDPQHPLRTLVANAVRGFASRVADGDPQALGQAEQLRHALLESLEAMPLVRNMLAQLRSRLEQDLDEPEGYLAALVDRELRAGIVELLDDPDRAAAFDHWVRQTADDLLQRHHHQIGVTVRENLEALETNALVAQIEDRVGADLQFIRLNGAVVGGLIGILLAALRLVSG